MAKTQLGFHDLMTLKLETMGQGQTVSEDQLMVFHDVTPISVNHVAFTSVTAANSQWTVPDEFIYGPGKFSSRCVELILLIVKSFRVKLG